MRRLTLLAGLVGLACLPGAFAAKPQTAGGKPVFTYPIEKTVLDNGLTVLSVPFDSPGIIAYYTIVRTGSRTRSKKGCRGLPIFLST